MSNRTILVVAIGAAIFLSIAAAAVLWLSHESWETANYERITTAISEATQLQLSDPGKAYQLLDTVLQEASTHEITDPVLQKRLDGASKIKNDLGTVVAKRQAEEAAAKKAAENKAKADAEAAIARQKAEEDRKAQEAYEAEKKVKFEARAKEYSTNFTKDDLAPLLSLQRLEAKVEVGMNEAAYRDAVGQCNGDVKVFLVSPEHNNWPEYASLVDLAVDKYKAALEVWQDKFSAQDEIRKDISEFGESSDWVKKDKKRVANDEALVQAEWHLASRIIKLTQKMIDAKDGADALAEYDRTHIKLIGTAEMDLKQSEEDGEK